MNLENIKWSLVVISKFLDKAIDEIQNGAIFVNMEKIVNPRDNNRALLVQNDGGQMDFDCMRQCMSLGYSWKNTTQLWGTLMCATVMNIMTMKIVMQLQSARKLSYWSYETTS